MQISMLWPTFQAGISWHSLFLALVHSLVFLFPIWQGISDYMEDEIKIYFIFGYIHLPQLQTCPSANSTAYKMDQAQFLSWGLRCYGC